MIKIFLVFLLIFFSAFILLGQGLNLPKNPGQVVAKIDSIKISAEEFFFSYEYGPAFIKRQENSKEKHLNYMINEKLLSLEGFSNGVDTTEQVKEMLDEFISDLATEELFKQEILNKLEITDEEVDTAIIKKNIELGIKWIYTDNAENMNEYISKIKSGEKFDSLFYTQINDSVYIDDRYLKIDRFKLEQQNPQLAGIVDSLKAGEVSIPVHVDDGWYLIKLENISTNNIVNEDEYNRLKQEAENALTKMKMDRLSDEYVNRLMVENKPVIKRSTFNLLRSYQGNLLLSKEKYNDWELSKKLSNAIDNIKKNSDQNFSDAPLVEMKIGDLTLKIFFIWYKNRSLYIKLNNENLNTFSASLESLVWRMVRDKLLARQAEEKGYNELASVKKQAAWWKEKIISSLVKNEIANSVFLEEKELKKSDNISGETAHAKFDNEFSAKLFRKINLLKKKYSINIDKNVLDDITVSIENDPKAVEFYTVKKGGIIPRTPYPTIDYDWINWE